MSELLRWLMLLMAAFLNMGNPAAGETGAGWEYGGAAVSAGERDPSYEIYQKYRYAYDTYGYLFLLSGEQEDSPGTQGGYGETGGAAVMGSAGEKEAFRAGEEAAVCAGRDVGEGTAASVDGASGSLTGEDGAGDGDGSTLASLPALAQLQDYDYLMKHFYSVHASTTAGRELMRAETLMGTDLRLPREQGKPQILIYHTHSQETYADYGPGNRAATVVSAGKYLAELLRQKGWNVIHDTSTYDIQGGTLDRSRAYNYALDGISGILQQNPTIQVILDLHRDGVREGVHLVSQVNGKQTANIMFFQGMSRTPEGRIEYLPNPYLQENLAFAFQMQYLAENRYPGFTRKIYLKGLRYNLHLRPRSSLIEVGAQTNTLAEAKNAMEPLAELLDTVLHE